VRSRRKHAREGVAHRAAWAVRGTTPSPAPNVRRSAQNEHPEPLRGAAPHPPPPLLPHPYGEPLRVGAYTLTAGAND
jgi:hypothetical protein